MDAFPRFDLGGRTALVTGASRGPGEAIALAPARARALATTADRGWAAR